MLKTRKPVSASWAAGSELWSGGSANSHFRYELMIQKSYVHARNLTRRWMIGAVTRQSSVRDRRTIYWGDPHIVSLVVMFVPERSLVFATQTDFSSIICQYFKMRFLSYTYPHKMVDVWLSVKVGWNGPWTPQLTHWTHVAPFTHGKLCLERIKQLIHPQTSVPYTRGHVLPPGVLSLDHTFLSFFFFLPELMSFKARQVSSVGSWGLGRESFAHLYSKSWTKRYMRCLVSVHLCWLLSQSSGSSFCSLHERLQQSVFKIDRQGTVFQKWWLHLDPMELSRSWTISISDWFLFILSQKARFSLTFFSCIYGEEWEWHSSLVAL